MFGFFKRSPRKRPDHSDRPHVDYQQVLAIAIEQKPTALQWVALVDNDGMLKAQIKVADPDAVSAMTTAAQSIGERIVSELENGYFRYSVTAGASGTLIIVRINEQFLLAANVDNTQALHEIMQALWMMVAVIAATL